MTILAYFSRILYADILLAFVTDTPVKVVEFWRTV